MFTTQQKKLLSSFTIEEIENPITLKSIADKMDLLADKNADDNDGIEQLKKAHSEFIKVADKTQASSEVVAGLLAECVYCGKMEGEKIRLQDGSYTHEECHFDMMQNEDNQIL